MKLLRFLKDVPKNGRVAFAERCGTKLGHLLNVAYECKPCSPDLAIAIERETAGAVSVADLRPEFAESLKAAGYVRIRSGPEKAA